MHTFEPHTFEPHAGIAQLGELFGVSSKINLTVVRMLFKVAVKFPQARHKSKVLGHILLVQWQNIQFRN